MSKKTILYRNVMTLVIISVISLLVLSACGDSATVQPASTGVTSTVLVGQNQSPAPQTLVAPPNKLAFGLDGNPWAEITRYTPASGTKLEELNLNQENKNNFGALFEDAPKLAPSIGMLATLPDTYIVKLRPDLQKGLLDGTLSRMQSLEGGYRGLVVDDKNIIRGQVSLQLSGGLQLAASGAIVWNVLSIITAQHFLSSINDQLAQINKSISEIKDFLQQKEYSALKGDLDYLEGIRTALNDQKLGTLDISAVRSQIETIDRESLQAVNFAQGQIQQIYTTYKETRIDKGFLTGTRDEKKIDDFGTLIANYQRNTQNYYIALSVRGLNAQITCALPQSRDLALTRLDAVRKELSTWYEEQVSFYDLVTNRIGEMDGTFVNSEKQDKFKANSASGKTQAKQAYEQADKLFADTI